MRPVLVAWLARHGLPAWLAPDYMVLVGVASLICAVMVLRSARREGAPVHLEARALLLAYIVAIPGGYVFEAIRAIPHAIVLRSMEPIFTAGRAAYGGLIASVAVSVLYLRKHDQPIGPHLDRIAPAAGIVFAFVRTGCFLAGCDYGRPTSSILGVRFPAESLAAIDHATRGFVPHGAPSLPVHATELYEVFVALLGASIALFVRARRRRAGDAFLVWIMVYAIGRFVVETLRGDAERGAYVGLSTAQWVSLIVVAVVMLVVSSRARRLAPVALALALFALPYTAHAQQPERPSQPSATAVAPKPYVIPPYVPPPPDPVRRFGIRATLTSALTLGRKDVPSGTAGEIAALYRAQLGSSTRLDFGLEYRQYGNVEAIHRAVGVPLFLVLEATRRFEFTFGLAFDHNWIAFRSPFFRPTNAWSTRYEIGLQGYAGDHFFIGGTIFAFNVLSAETIGVITSYEPRIWIGLAF